MKLSTFASSRTQSRTRKTTKAEIIFTHPFECFQKLEEKLDLRPLISRLNGTHEFENWSLSAFLKHLSICTFLCYTLRGPNINKRSSVLLHYEFHELDHRIVEAKHSTNRRIFAQTPDPASKPTKNSSTDNKRAS